MRFNRIGSITLTAFGLTFAGVGSALPNQTAPLSLGEAQSLSLRDAPQLAAQGAAVRAHVFRAREPNEETADETPRVTAKLRSRTPRSPMCASARTVPRDSFDRVTRGITSTWTSESPRVCAFT